MRREGEKKELRAKPLNNFLGPRKGVSQTIENFSSISPFEQIREKHPNAYRSWSKEQDEELKNLFVSGISIPDLMKKFGRKRGGITARLEKLGLVEK